MGITFIVITPSLMHIRLQILKDKIREGNMIMCKRLLEKYSDQLGIVKHLARGFTDDEMEELSSRLDFAFICGAVGLPEEMRKDIEYCYHLVDTIILRDLRWARRLVKHSGSEDYIGKLSILPDDILRIISRQIMRID